MSNNNKKLILQQIKLNSYGFHSGMTIRFENSISFIIGQNGSGKTILLFAIGYLEYFRDLKKLGDYGENVIKDFHPDIEYSLNPVFFGFGTSAKPIIVQISHKTMNIIRNPYLDEGIYTNKIKDLITKKLKIVFWDLPKILTQTHQNLSYQERIIRFFESQYQKIKNSLILIDDLYGLDTINSDKCLFYIEELSKCNQVIITTNSPLFLKADDDYRIIALPNPSDLFSRYSAELIISKSEFFHEFEESLYNTITLLEFSISDEDLKRIHNNLLFVNVITSMETYLSDVFIKKILEDEQLILKLLQNVRDFKERKYRLYESYKWIKDLNENIKKVLVEISFHNIWKVKDMYKKVLNVKFPEDLREIINAVMVRHAIVHNNGRTREGVQLMLSKSEVHDVIKKVRVFIKYIDNQIN